MSRVSRVSRVGRVRRVSTSLYNHVTSIMHARAWQRESDVLCVLSDQLRLEPLLTRRLAAALGYRALEIDPHLTLAVGMVLESLKNSWVREDVS